MSEKWVTVTNMGTGGTRKVADLPVGIVCRSPEHLPPSHQVFEPGIYEHTCPACGHVTRFTVMGPTW